MQTNNAKRRYIPELLTLHCEELEFLWGQRRLALHSPRYFLRDFLHLTERIEAHLQGLLAVPDALPDLLLPQLAEADEQDRVFALVCPLLRLQNPVLTAQLVEFFTQSTLKTGAGFRDAFSFAPAGLYIHELQRILRQEAILPAVYAMTALANLRALERNNDVLQSFLFHSDALVAKLAWQASLTVDCLPATMSSPPRPYQQTLVRPEASLREVALKSALWTRQAWVLSTLRQMTLAGDITALQWLAIVSQGEEGALIVDKLALVTDLSKRCEIVTRFGHPALLPLLQEWATGDDVLLGSYAGAAFTRITGVDVRGERVPMPVAQTADEFERDFAPLIWTADVSKMKSYLAQCSYHLQQANRWSRGVCLDGVLRAESLAEIDLQIRWDQAARHRLVGNISNPPEPIF